MSKMNQEFIIENAERVLFRDMSEDDQIAILKAKLNVPESVEIFFIKGGKSGTECILIDSAYRVRASATPLVIPWEVISPEWDWAAMDQNGRPFLYGEEPIENGGTYVAGIARSIDFLNIDLTGIDWRRSKTRRPV